MRATWCFNPFLLTFLFSVCRPNAGDCPGYQPSSIRHDDSKNIQTQTIETRYLTNEAVFSDNFQPTVEDQATSNPISWIPSRDGRRKTTKTNDLEFPSDQKTTSANEETSSRSSFGRGMTWDATEPTKEDIFKVTHYKPSTESWYPGNNINFQTPEKDMSDFQSNQVDEPNQQGLSHADADGGAASLVLRFSYVLILVVAQFLT